MKKINLILGILFVFLLSISFVSAHAGEDHSGMMGGMYGVYSGTEIFFGWLFGILVLVALVLLIVWLIKQIQSPLKRK